MHEPDSPHPSPEQLRAFSLYQADDGAVEWIAAHLNGCGTCRALLDDLFAQQALLSQVRAAAAPAREVQEDVAQRRQAAHALVRRGRQADPATPPAVLAPSDVPAARPAPGHEPALPRQVGEYEVLAEVGRGGMGVVYKARHQRLRRLVALKMMLSGLFASPRERLRFQLEAELAARVRHPNIVQVYEVGSYEGRPFLALEWVEGGSLADRLDGTPWPAEAAALLIETLARAIHVAHCEGVVHRDLKPANILVQEEEGGRSKEEGEESRSGLIPGPSSLPKITDFGLAQPVEGGPALTQTGALVGTPGYMAPEQAAGKRALVGPATDTYALGVVLYQLLTGQRPFQGASCEEVLRAVLFDEPARPRRLQPRLPRDLEAITLRCLEKEPARRYPSAAELAADIRRYLRHEPIQARPQSALYQLGKLARRHKALVATTAAFLSLLLLAGALTAWQQVRLARKERDQAVQQAGRSQEVQDALAQADLLREQARTAAGDVGQWAKAREAAQWAEARAKEGVAPGLAERVAALLHELDEEENDRGLVALLGDIRLPLQQVLNAPPEQRASRYAEAFRGHGLDVEALPIAEAARRVRASAIREELLAALDHWAWHQEGPGQAKLWDVAAAADDNPWRRRLRKAARQKDQGRLKELAADTRALEQPAAVQALLGKALLVARLPADAVAFLRQAQRRHPDDFWLNHDLASALLTQLRPPRPEEALGYYRAALVLRPRSPGLHFNIGTALLEQGTPVGAEAYFRRALELEPRSVEPLRHLGLALQQQGDLAGSLECARQAVALGPNDPISHNHLGVALQMRGDLPGAVASFRRATDLAPKDTAARFNLGLALLEQGDLPAAAACFRRATVLAPKDARALLWVQRCQRFLQLADRLPALLKGEAQPAGTADLLALAELCHYKGLHTAAARFYSEAFAADAKRTAGMPSGPRYQAACAAALAAAGRGEDAARLDEAGRARLRGQALKWLHDDLAVWARYVQRGSPSDLARVRMELGRWQVAPALAGVRDAGPLAALPSEERAGWQKLWADVAATQARARTGS